MSKRIIITVPRDPSKGIRVEVEGATGQSCTELTANIENALGKVQDRTLKDEYHQIDSGQQLNQQQ